MNLLTIISFLIILLIVIVSIVKKSDLFSPAKIFGIIWALSIGLTQLKLSRLQHEWNSMGWIMLFIGIFSFLVGNFSVFVINNKKEIVTLKSFRIAFSKELIYPNKFLLIIISLFIIYLISFLGNYLIEGYLPVFHLEAGQSRMFWGVFGIGLTVHLATPLLLFIFQYIRLAKPNKSTKISLFLLAAFIGLTYLTLLQRFNLIFAIVIVVTFLYYTTDFLKLRNLLVSALVLVTIMYSVMFLRISSFALSYMYTMAQMKFNFKYALFTEPYMYFVMNLENFVRGTDQLETHTYGYYTFKFLFSLTGIKRMLIEYFQFNDFPHLNSSYNTYSMFWEYFRDFGVWGLFIIPFILGFAGSTIYYKMRTKPSLVTISCYSIFVFLIVISFFVNVIGLLHFVFNSIVIILVAKYAERKINSNPLITN